MRYLRPSVLRAQGPGRLPTFARAFRRGLPVVALLAVAPLGGLGAAALAIGPAAAAAACTGDVAGVSVYGGGGQVAKVGTAFSTPLEAEVVDSGGCPVANAPVEFVLPAGPAASSPGTPSTLRCPRPAMVSLRPRR